MFVDTRIPWMFMQSTLSLSLSSVKGKGSSSPRDGCLKCGGAHFQRDCNARRSTGKQSYGKGKQSKSWSKSEPLKTRNRRQVQKLRNRHTSVPLIFPGTMVGIVTNGMMAGVLKNGMMTGVLSDGTKVGNKRMTLPQAHFHLQVWMLVPPVVRRGSNG